MHLAVQASIGLLLLAVAATKADVSHLKYDHVAQPSQHQASFSASANTVGHNGARGFHQSSASYSGHNNGQHFGGSVVNNNGQVSHHAHHGGAAQKDYWWQNMGDASPFKQAAAAQQVASSPCNTNVGCSASTSSVNIVAPAQQQVQHDYSHNPFLNGGHQIHQQAGNGNKGAANTHSVNSFVVSGSHYNDNGASKSQYNKNSQFISASQSSYKTPCNEQGKICAPKSFCKNGLVRSDQLSLLDDSRSECESGETCCKIHFGSQAGSPFQSNSQVRCRSGNQKCVPSYMCVNGELSGEGLRYAARLLPAQTCSNGDVCCSAARALSDSQPAAQTLTSNGYVLKVPDRRYLPSVDPERPDEEPAQSGNDVQNVPTATPPPVPSTTYLPATTKRPVAPQRPSYRPPVTQPPRQFDEVPQSQNNNPTLLIPVGCPAAMNCTDRQYCDAGGMISKTPVDLSPEQALFRVPLIECRDRKTGQDGVCCRDPDYTDPWPTEILGQYRPDLLGFDDGSYKPEASNRRSVQVKASASHVAPQRVRPGTPLRAAASNQVSRQVPSPNSLFSAQQVKPSVCGKRDRNTEPRGQTETEANFAEFPWQVMVARESTKTLLCGGVIVGPHHVLATAKCVEGVRPSDIVTKVGEWQLGENSEPRKFQILHVRSVQPHPQYNPNTLEYDMAIIHLSEQINFDQHVAPICMDEQESSKNLDNCVTTGWGKDALRVHARGAIMHYTDVYMMPQETCSDYLQTYDFNAQSSVCGHTRVDACQVDAGSALACQRPSGDYVLKGIYSSETECNTDSQLVTFTKVDPQWVKAAMNGRSSVPHQQAQASERRDVRVQPANGYLPPRN
ncbi:inactive serine protease scarface-like [Culicoides brevitarsis]|uniref:inactive serine protease scarface-like n=1 Tax=Culicoides brevitarsis TaxID=469753 RepID=UPI00307C84FD